MNKQVEFLTKLRDGLAMATDAVNEYLDSLPLTPKDVNASVIELTFSTLRFEPQQGEKLGEYERASKSGNLAEKWSHAYNVLRNSNATIQNRYKGEGYQYAYWLYGENTIFRQKIKA